MVDKNIGELAEIKFGAQVSYLRVGETDPRGIVRDQGIKKCINFSIMNRKRFLDDLTPEEMADPNDIHGRSTKRFVFLAGQPREVWETYCEAMGFEN